MICPRLRAFLSNSFLSNRIGKNDGESFKRLDHKKDVIGTLKHPLTCSEELRVFANSFINESS